MSWFRYQFRWVSLPGTLHELLDHLRRHGWALFREGGRPSIFQTRPQVLKLQYRAIPKLIIASLERSAINSALRVYGDGPTVFEASGAGRRRVRTQSVDNKLCPRVTISVVRSATRIDGARGVVIAFPILTVIAGPNGSGKQTLARFVGSDPVALILFIDFLLFAEGSDTRGHRDLGLARKLGRRVMKDRMRKARRSR